MTLRDFKHRTSRESSISAHLKSPGPFKSRGILGEPEAEEDSLKRETPFIFCTVFAAIVLHAPGLYCQLKYNSSSPLTILGALMGSVCEGVFALLLLTKVLGLTMYYRERTVAVFKAGVDPILNYIVSLSLLFWSIMMLVFIPIMFIAFTVADYAFLSMSGGYQVDMWIVSNGIKNAADVGRQLATNDSGDGDGRVHVVLFSFVCSLAIYATGQRFRSESKKRVKGKNQCDWLGSTEVLLAVGAASVLVYAFGAWSPIMHSYMSFLGSFIFTPEGSTITIETAIVSESAKKSAQRPNVIYVVPDSLSGPYLFTEEGQKATPFLQDLLKKNETYYFPHARAVSGNTIDALTALITGCLPYTPTGKEIAFSRSIATEFKRQGYQTASLSTAKIDLQVGAWQMINNYLTGNMDYVFDPSSENHGLVSGEGSDDRLFMPVFEKWLAEDVYDPFYAQIYQFNTHYPYLKDASSTASHRYYSSIETFDETLKKIFSILEMAGQSDNTVIIVTGDHGEHLSKKKYSRVMNLNPYILQPMTFMYIPDRLFTSEDARETLRSNQDKVVSTLDLFPTMQHIIYGGDAKETSQERTKSKAADVSKDEELEHCVTGFDLMSTSIPDDRVAISWNSLSKMKRHDRLLAISNAERGMYRKGDWKWGLRQMRYGNCTTSGEGECVEDMTEADRTYWKGIVQGMYNCSTMSNQFMNSKFISYFQEELDMYRK